MILPNGVLRVATQIFRPIFCMLEPGHLKMHIAKGKGNTSKYYRSRVKNYCFCSPSAQSIYLLYKYENKNQGMGLVAQVSVRAVWADEIKLKL